MNNSRDALVCAGCAGGALANSNKADQRSQALGDFTARGDRGQHGLAGVAGSVEVLDEEIP